MANDRTNTNGTTDTRGSGSRWLIALVIIGLIVVAAFAFGFVNVDQTRDARMPDVKVQTSGGQAPAFDVNTAEVDVGTRTEAIEVPTVDVRPAKNN